MDWLARQLDDPKPRRRSYRDRLEYAPDPLKDIGDLGIDYFWCKCEELLPDDWAFGLFASPNGEQLMYQARAALVSDDDALPVLPHVITEWRTTPLRAIEDLYYALRGML